MTGGEQNVYMFPPGGGTCRIEAPLSSPEIGRDRPYVSQSWGRNDELRFRRTFPAPLQHSHYPNICDAATIWVDHSSLVGCSQGGVVLLHPMYPCTKAWRHCKRPTWIWIPHGDFSFLAFRCLTTPQIPNDASPNPLPVRAGHLEQRLVVLKTYMF